MSPRNWNNPTRSERTNALVIFKFAVGRTLRQLTDDVSSWAWPEVAAFPGGTIDDARVVLQDIYKSAAEAYARTSEGGKSSPYAHFIQLLDEPTWTGIIAFSVDVPLRSLPAPLQALSAGIDADNFYAHHVGFNITPFGADPGSLAFGQTSTFGLIDYQDHADQFFEENIHFAFKVLQLTLAFRNSVITDFSSQIELLVNRLFGAVTRVNPTEHGNNVILDGVYQEQAGADGLPHGTYVFSLRQQNTIEMDYSALRQVVLRSTRLVTTKPADPSQPSSQAVSTFVMGGDMEFYEPPRFDPFSFGGTETITTADSTRTIDSRLRFDNLAIQMTFTPGSATPPVFSLVTEALSFDLANSRARTKSLFSAFPLKLSGFLATPDPELARPPQPPSKASVQGPETFGFVTVGVSTNDPTSTDGSGTGAQPAPVFQQARMLDPWYGIVYDIDLGTLGALAGSVGLTLSVLVAWSGGGTREEPAIYLGVRLPGIRGALGISVALEGILSLGFRNIQFLASDDPVTQRREYMLRLRNFALRFLGLAFPPGHNDIYLFGNPDQSGATPKLGWYAAYSKGNDEKKGRATRPTRTARRLARHRRAVSVPRQEGESA
jgi:hypothetical protein